MDKQDAKIIGQGIVWAVLIALLLIALTTAMGLAVRIFLWVAFG